MSDAANKIAIVGAGSVGATIAYACMIRGVAKQFSLYDVDAQKAHAQALDLLHGLQFVPPANIEGSDDLQICAGADVLVITAGARQKPGMTRMDLADQNTLILKKLIPELMNVAPQSLLLLVTNPVDVLTYIALKLSGLPRARVMGSGTVLDSSRFRLLIAQRLRVAVQNVHAYIAGEHGDSEVPLWSSASVANIPLHEWAVMHHGKLDVRDRTEIFQNVKSAAYQIIQGKGATNFAIGLATAKILESILHNENRILPVSSLLTNYQPMNRSADAGISDVCLSVPSIVNRAGVEPPLPLPMNAAEQAALRNSADTLRAAIVRLGF
jgi:L-lactate dehydrogenase